jgi:hypothetical protein
VVVPATDHFARATYRACVARGAICIVRIVIPRKPKGYRYVKAGPAALCSADTQRVADKSTSCVLIEAVL